MASATKFEGVGTFQDFEQFESGPAKGHLKQLDGTLLEVKVWPTIKDFRDNPPTTSANPAYIAAQASEGGKWTGYSKLESWEGKDGQEVAARRWYLTGYEPDEWTTADGEPIAETATIIPPQVAQTLPSVNGHKISAYSLGSAARIVAGLAAAGKVDVEGAVGLWIEFAKLGEEAMKE